MATPQRQMGAPLRKKVGTRPQPVVSQDDIESLFGTNAAAVIRENQSALKLLEARKGIMAQLDAEAEAARTEMEEEQKLREEYEEIRASFQQEGVATGFRVTLGKLVSRIPLIGAQLRGKFDKAKMEHVLQACVNLYRDHREVLGAKLGKRPSDGPTIEQYIEQVRQDRDNTFAKLKEDIATMKDVKGRIFEEKKAVLQVALKYVPAGTLAEFELQSPEDLNVLVLEQATYAAAPKVTTDEGVKFREEFTAATRELRDVQEELVKVSAGINRAESLVEFYRYEEGQWAQLKDGAERIYEIIDSTIDDRERIVRAGIEAAALETTLASGIKRGEDLKNLSSKYLLWQAKLMDRTIRASRVADSKIVNQAELDQCEAIVQGLEEHKNVLQVTEYKEAEEVAKRHENE